MRIYSIKLIGATLWQTCRSRLWLIQLHTTLKHWRWLGILNTNVEIWNKN